MKYLNLGCGSRYRKNWINIDFVSTNPSIKAHNLRSGIPLSDNSVDLVYCSHLLEHFAKTEAPIFLAECLRVLRPGGVLRVVVPDLEGIACAYLKSLDDVRMGIAGADDRHEWMIIELLDQMVREKPGGEMLKYLSQPNIPAKEFVLKRLGSEAKKIIDGAQLICGARQFSEKKKRRYLRGIMDLALSILQRSQKPNLEFAAFRKSGEVHRWMYDRFSLARLIEHVGFKSIMQRTAFESFLSDWATHNLDTEQDGSIYKPDSLFMEGLKP